MSDEHNHQLVTAMDAAAKYRESNDFQSLSRDSFDLVVLADEVIRLRQQICLTSKVVEPNPHEMVIEFVKPDKSPPLSMAITHRSGEQWVEVRDEVTTIISYSVDHFGMLDAVSRAVQEITSMENPNAR